MKLPEEKIEALCKPEYSRCANVHYFAEQDVLFATDGCAMAFAKATGSKGNPTGTISPEEIRKARANGGVVKVVTADEFKGWRKPIDGMDARLTISLDAALLYKLACAICTDDTSKNVKLYVHGLESPILVEPLDGESAIGAMMPIRTYEPKRKSSDVIKKFFPRKSKKGGAA